MMRCLLLRRTLFAALCASFVALHAGCGAVRTEYSAALSVERQSWDTLSVAVMLTRRTALGAPQRFQPDSTSVSIFDAAYNVLYDGPARDALPLPDARLGSREILLVEACGAFQGRTLCEQQSLMASPKRLSVSENISFPEDEHFREGRYDLRFDAERRRFDGEGWERIESGRTPGGYLLAYVGSQRQDAVRVPLSPSQGTQSRGRFDLARYAHYNDFKFHLESKLFDGEAANVSFDVYAGLGPEARRIGRASTTVRRKQPEEREAELRFYAEQAASEIIERMGGAAHGQGAVAYVDSWHYDRFQERYTAEMEMRWRSTRRHQRYVLKGTLEVDQAERQARFRLAARSNRAAERRWHRRADEDVMALGPLEPLPKEPPEELLPEESGGRLAG